MEKEQRTKLLIIGNGVSNNWFLKTLICFYFSLFQLLPFKMNKQPQAQEIVNWCDTMIVWEWVEWYNFRLKLLNDKSEY